MKWGSKPGEDLQKGRYYKRKREKNEVRNEYDWAPIVGSPSTCQHLSDMATKEIAFNTLDNIHRRLLLLIVIILLDSPFEIKCWYQGEFHNTLIHINLTGQQTGNVYESYIIQRMIHNK